MAFEGGRLLPITPPKSLPVGIPRVFDDTSFAFSLGLRCRTVWWLVHTTKLDLIDRGIGPYDKFKIPKKNGTFRLIHAPRKTLKRVQRVLLHTYFDPLPVEDWIGAYVPGRDMVYSVNKHVGKDVVIGMDLSNFFNSTRRRWVREWLAGLGFPIEVIVPLSGLLCVPFGGKRGLRYALPQGAPTSGAVANHVATARLDKPLMAALESAGLQDLSYTRYADDLTISYNGWLAQPDFHDLMERVREVIHLSGYRLNTKKTRVMVSRPGLPIPQRMLGMSIQEKLNVPREKRRLLRSRVHTLCHKLDAVLDESDPLRRAYVLNEEAGKLSAELSYWARISPETITPLQEKLARSYLHV